MHILLLSQEASPVSGWGRVSSEMIHSILHHGDSVVVGSFKETELDPRVEQWLSLYSQINWAFKPVLAVFDAIRLLLKVQTSVDLIICTDETPVILATIMSFMLKKPYFVMAHGTYALRCQKSIHPRIHRFCYSKAKKIFLSSNFTKLTFDALSPTLIGKTEVLKLGRGEIFENRANASYFIRKNQIVTVGAIKARKGLLYLLRAMSLIEEHHRPILCIVGSPFEDPKYVDQAKALIKTLNLSEFVKFYGMIPEDDLFTLYEESRLFVLPSQNTSQGDFEGFGLVHIEAQSFGLPAIGSLGCGNEDAILDGETGYLVPQGDEAVLANRIRDVIFDEARWNRLSERAYKFSQTFDWSETYASILRKN